MTMDYAAAAKELRAVTDARATQLGAWVVMAARWYQENDFTEFRAPPGRYYLADPVPLLMRGGRFSIINEGEVVYYLHGADCFVRTEGDMHALSTIDINNMIGEV